MSASPADQRISSSSSSAAVLDSARSARAAGWAGSRPSAAGQRQGIPVPAAARVRITRLAYWAPLDVLTLQGGVLAEFGGHGLLEPGRGQ